MEGFTKGNWRVINENAIKLIGIDWFLITAGKIDTDYNTMTAAWGSIGWLWEKPVTFIFVRPQRHTYGFCEREDYYTMSFFDKKYKDALNICGTLSGRDTDKIKIAGITPIETANSVAFDQARLIIESKKLFATDLLESDFISKEVIKAKYPNKDFHRMYVGEIHDVWYKE